MQSQLYDGFAAYPLRPEFAESLYYLFHMTHNPHWLQLGRDIVTSLQALCWTECGYAALSNVTSNQKRDWMDSFFLSETLKYLYLLFDEGTRVNDQNLKRGIIDGNDVVFTTEAHPISRRVLELLQVPGDYYGSPSHTIQHDKVDHLARLESVSDFIEIHNNEASEEEGNEITFDETQDENSEQLASNVDTRTTRDSVV